MAKGNYKIVSGEVGGPIYAVWDDGTVERAFENAMGPNSGSSSPYLIPESLVKQYQGQVGLNSADPFASTFAMPSQYAPAIYRKSKDSFVDKFAIPAFMAGLGGTALAGGSGGEVISGGADVAELAGGAGADTLSGGFTGGLTGNVTGAPGFSGAVTGAPGMSTAGASGALAPGFFGAETLAPVMGGIASGAGSAVGGSAAGGLLGGATAPLAGAVLGGLLAGSGSKQAGVTTTTQEPWGPQQPYIKNALNSASQQLNQHGTQTPLLGPAQAEMGKTISGSYLNPGSNPYLDATFNQAARQVTDVYKDTIQPRTDSMFFGPGSMGGNTAYQQMVARNQYGLGENLSNLATNIYGGNYQQERGRQFQATSLAPDFTSAYYGGLLSPQSQYLNVVGRPFGGSQSQPYYENKGAGLLGGALTGAAIGRMFFQ